MLALGRNATSRVEDGWHCWPAHVELRYANPTYFRVTPLPGAAAPVPWRQGVGVHPEACFSYPCFVLGELITVLILFSLFGSVVPIPPGQADRELCHSRVQCFWASNARLRTGIRRRNHDFSDDASMVVAFFILDRNCFIKQQAVKILFGLAAKSLLQLRRINS